MRKMHAYQRQAALLHLVDRCGERADELAEGLCVEAGKPIQYARGEVTRLIDTLRMGAEEAVRIYGEVMPLDVSPRAAGYRGMWKRVPIGPCGFITPWNFPLNLVAHKIAPALACGCPFVLKPASTTPIGALILGEMLAETDLPEGAFSILPMAMSSVCRCVFSQFSACPSRAYSLPQNLHRKISTFSGIELLLNAVGNGPVSHVVDMLHPSTSASGGSSIR
jgi:acyl-CoA reductase-like NAD-dependent aldehyde dehydrogenase